MGCQKCLVHLNLTGLHKMWLSLVEVCSIDGPENKEFGSGSCQQKGQALIDNNMQYDQT